MHIFNGRLHDGQSDIVPNSGRPLAFSRLQLRHTSVTHFPSSFVRIPIVTCLLVLQPCHIGFLRQKLIQNTLPLKKNEQQRRAQPRTQSL